MHTRKAFLNGKISFNEYYGQFVDEDIKKLVIYRFGLNELKIALLADEHLNNIPLEKWDLLTHDITIEKQMRKAGDYPTLAGKVCILKEAARRAVLD